MPVADALLIVEGPQDAEFAGRLLKAAGYRRLTDPGQLPEDWRKLIPTRFPKANRGIDQIHEVPQFRRQDGGTALVTTVIAGGDAKLASALVAALDSFGRVPGAVGIVLDDDRAADPRQRQAEVVGAVNAVTAGTNWTLEFPAEPGTVEPGAATRLGVFVLPDNETTGTLENVLVEAGQVAYGRLLEQANEFVAHLDRAVLTSEDLREGNKPSGQRKQVVGVATAILKPGRTVAVSLQDNRWLEGEALQTPLVARFRGWLHQLLDLPAPDA